jgi:hypothetical protein
MSTITDLPSIYELVEMAKNTEPRKKTDKESRFDVDLGQSVSKALAEQGLSDRIVKALGIQPSTFTKLQEKKQYSMYKRAWLGILYLRATVLTGAFSFEELDLSMFNVPAVTESESTTQYPTKKLVKRANEVWTAKDTLSKHLKDVENSMPQGDDSFYPKYNAILSGVRGVIGETNDNQQSLFLIEIVDKVSVVDIANLMGVSPETFKSWQGGKVFRTTSEMYNTVLQEAECLEADINVLIEDAKALYNSIIARPQGGVIVTGPSTSKPVQDSSLDNLYKLEKSLKENLMVVCQLIKDAKAAQ